MKVLWFTWPVFFCCSYSLQAQAVYSSSAAGYIGSGAYSRSQLDAFSFTRNQAVLADLKNASFGVYHERKFLLQELSLYNMVFVLPTNTGNVAFTGGYYGSSEYHETTAGVSYAKKLGDKIALGVQFNYYGTGIKSYGKSASLGCMAGLLMHLSNKLTTGIQVCNPVSSNLSRQGTDNFRFIYLIGMGFEASPQFFISTELEKPQNSPINVFVCMQYRLQNHLLGRCSISTANSSISCGLGIIIKSLRIDITAGFHRPLGMTPGILLLFENHDSPHNENIQ